MLTFVAKQRQYCHITKFNCLIMNHLTDKSKELLESVARFSSNEICSARAKMYLNPPKGVDVERIAKGEGSFMSACLLGDFDLAYNLADGSNREALTLGVAEGIITHNGFTPTDDDFEDYYFE